MQENGIDSHQQEFPINGLVFFSNFDSGNLLQVSKFGQFNYELQIAPDAYLRGFNHYRVWFYFGIRGLTKGQSIRISIMNLSSIRAFSSTTYRPVFRELPKNSVWQRLPTECRFEPSQHRLSWCFQASDSNQELYFAFAPPYTLQNAHQMLDFLEAHKQSNTYYHKEVLVYSPDRRPVHLLTITDYDNVKLVREDSLPHIFPDYAARAFKGKKPIIAITARVHPGETPASYFLEAFLQFLISTDRRAELLRKNFVFKVVPVLNVDGVYSGHFRVDQFGVNLNRSYIAPSLEMEPAIYAVKTYLDFLHNCEGGIYFYMDVHAQSSKKSCWLFGNALDSDLQVENLMVPRVMGMNSVYFDFNDCDFTEHSMQHRDPKDLNSKEGSARVAVHKRLGLVRSYTLECSYYCPQPLSKISAIAKRKNRDEYCFKGAPIYNRFMFKELAEGFAMTLLDLNCINPFSRLGGTPQKALSDLRELIRAKLTLAARLKNSRQAKDIPSKVFRTRTCTPIRKLP